MNEFRSKMIGRRSFITGGLAAGLLSGCRMPWTFGERPLLTVGVVSDPHLDARYPHRSRLLAQAFARLRDAGAEAVVVAGDLTERGLKEDLRTFADVWHGAFPGGLGPTGEKVELFAVYGNRDLMCSGKTPPAFREAHRAEAIYPAPAAAWKECFGEEGSDGFLFRRIRGYSFFGAHWGAEKGDVKAFLAAHPGAIDPSRPFFFVQHPHPDFTCFAAWGCDAAGATVEALRDCGNAIAVSGHSHRSLADDHCVWQGPFVSVAGGSTWDAVQCDESPDPRLLTRSQYALMRVYPGRVVYERRDVLTDGRVGDDIAWTEPDPSAGGSLRFATWNIGHYSWGRASNPTVTSPEVPAIARNYRRFLNVIDADVLGVCEYSEELTCDGDEKADEHIFPGYPQAAKGPKRAFQHDVVFFRRFRELERRQRFYPKHQQDTYYQAVKLDVFGRGVWFVETHLDWKIWQPGHAGDRIDQMKTLIADFASEPYVVIGGDFNIAALNPDGTRRFMVEEFGLFADAGYRMANDGSVATAKRNAPLDNIFVRGLEMSDVRFHKAGDLSDHDAVSCRLGFAA